MPPGSSAGFNCSNADTSCDLVLVADTRMLKAAVEPLSLKPKQSFLSNSSENFVGTSRHFAKSRQNSRGSV